MLTNKMIVVDPKDWSEFRKIVLSQDKQLRDEIQILIKEYIKRNQGGIQNARGKKL